MNQRYYADPFYYNTKTVYTIHNLRFQGQFSSHAVRHLGYRFDDIQINNTFDFQIIGKIYV